MVTVSWMKFSHAFAVLFGVFSPLFAFAWNAEGHRVIAQIAYNHMTPTAKVRFKVTHPVLDKYHKPSSFIEAAVWLDTLRHEENSKALGAMHYVDIPFSIDGTRAPKPQKMNGLMAYHQSRAILLDSHVSLLERVVALRILIHVAGDLHQPLHATTRVSRAYPDGDAGGNRVVLPRNKIAKNLHAYWDRGGGVLLYNKDDYNTVKRVQRRARELEDTWPCQAELMDKDPVHWIAESHDLAVSEAYSITAKNFLSGAYQSAVSCVAAKRLAVAGCRLASVLNELDAYLSHAVS